MSHQQDDAHDPGHAASISAPVGSALPAAAPGTASSPGQPERAVRALRAGGQLAAAVALVDQLGPYGVADGIDGTTSLGAAVLAAYGDQHAAADRAAADAAYLRAAQGQRLFAAAVAYPGRIR